MKPEITRIVISLLLTFTISSTGLFQFASAFVNIISPSKGEAVPAGSPLTVSGTSDDSVETNCNIQIIVNDHRPYQDTIPVAPGDYSEWTFVISPQYAEIEEGINTITSKASCDAPLEPVLKLDPLARQYVKYYGINVTGVPSGIGVDSEEPAVVPAPEPNGGFEGEEEEEDEDSTSEDSLFG
ncbi:MAG: hypothetical protein M3297_11565 [Thermoproteota archaeon]|jgi:hypothetical protein|nr:hypothetical protein [Thermoproteota archaeon]